MSALRCKEESSRAARGVRHDPIHSVRAAVCAGRSRSSKTADNILVKV